MFNSFRSVRTCPESTFATCSNTCKHLLIRSLLSLTQNTAHVMQNTFKLTLMTSSSARRALAMHSHLSQNLSSNVILKMTSRKYATDWRRKLYCFDGKGEGGHWFLILLSTSRKARSASRLTSWSSVDDTSESRGCSAHALIMTSLRPNDTPSQSCKHEATKKHENRKINTFKRNQRQPSVIQKELDDGKLTHLNQKKLFVFQQS